MTADGRGRDTAGLPRDERRRRTESAILDAARQQFAEDGYERVTIRGVASQAGIDPALVMQHFGSKEQLFAAVARWPAEHQQIEQATPDALPAAALADVFARFESDDRESVVALLRSCLTHPSATAIVRDQVMCDRTANVSATLEGEDAELRAGLIGACTMGLSMARYVMEVEPLASASREDLERLFLPAIRALVEPPP